MTEEDKELEILKAKRLAEMEKNLAQQNDQEEKETMSGNSCLLYTSPSPRDRSLSRMPSSA